MSILFEILSQYKYFGGGIPILSKSFSFDGLRFNCIILSYELIMIKELIFVFLNIILYGLKVILWN